MQGRGEEEENKEVSLAPNLRLSLTSLHPKVTATQHFNDKSGTALLQLVSQDQMSFESWVSYN